MKPALLLCALPLFSARAAMPLPPMPAQDRAVAVQADDPADTLALRDVEVVFHRAGSVLPAKDLDLMMSLYADDAVLIDTAHGNKAYTGKQEVRRYWEQVSGPFRPEHKWIGYTPAMRIKTSVRGEAGSLYFECLWMDTEKEAIGAHSFSDMTLAKVRGRWQVKTIKVGLVAKL